MPLSKKEFHQLMTAVEWCETITVDGKSWVRLRGVQGIVKTFFDPNMPEVPLPKPVDDTLIQFDHED